MKTMNVTVKAAAPHAPVLAGRMSVVTHTVLALAMLGLALLAGSGRQPVALCDGRPVLQAGSVEQPGPDSQVLWSD